MDERNPFNRIFESMANVLLEQQLPRIREWIASRFPGATLGGMELDGKRVHVLDARIPIGTRILIEAQRATLITRAEDLVSGGLSALTLSRLEGAITIGGTIRASVTIEGDPPGNNDDWVRGQLTLRDLSAAGEVYSGRARVLINPEIWSIQEGVIEREGARLTIAMDGGIASRRFGKLRSSASAFPSAAIIEVLDALGATFVPAIARTIRARVSGTVQAEPDRDRLEARLDLRTDVSHLALELEGGMRAIRAASAKGKIAWQDVLAPELYLSHVRGASPISVHLEGSSLLDARGSVRCPQLDLRWLRAPLAIGATIADGRADLSIEGEGVELEGEATFSGDGALRGGGSGAIDPRALIASMLVPELEIDGEPLALGMTLSGTTRAPSFTMSANDDRLVARRSGAELALRRVRASVRDGSIEASARLDGGTIAFSRRDATEQIRIERVSARNLGKFFAPKLPIPFDADLWATLSRSGGAWTGRAHLEGERSRITAAPLRYDERERALDGTRLSAILGAGDLSTLLGDPPFSIVRGAISVEVSLDRAPLGIDRLREARAQGLAESAVLEVGLREGRTFTVSALRAPLAVEGALLRVDGAEARLFGGIVRASGSLDPSGARLDALAIERVGAGLARWLLGGPPTDAWSTLSIGGALARDAGHALAGKLAITTERSSIILEPRVAREGALSGSRIDGSISTIDLAPFLGGILDETSWEIAARVDGTIRDPIAALEARSTRQLVHAGAVKVALDEPRLSVKLARGSLTWSDVSARVHGGTLRSRGAWIGRVLGARVTIEGAQVGTIALGDGELASYFGGSAHATIDVWRSAGMFARGSLRVDGPSYAFLDHARGIVQRLGLSFPSTQGVEPLSVRARLEGREVRVTDLAAQIESLAVRGHGAIASDGAASGELMLSPRAEWLRTSSYLSPLADLLAKTGLPLWIGGALGSVRVRPDLAQLGDGMLARSGVGKRVRELLEQVFPDAFERPSRPGERDAHAAQTLLSTDAIFERLAEDPEDYAQLVEALLDRGMSPHEIAIRVARR